MTIRYDARATPAQLYRQRIAQIKWAYEARNLPTLTRSKGIDSGIKKGIKRVSKPIATP